MKKKPTVFLCYSHKDEALKDRLMVHLGPFEREGQLELWSDKRIAAGLDWEGAIEDAIDSSCLSLLLISADFLNSRFIQGTEVPRMLEARSKRGMQLFPILLKSCLWEEVPWLAPLQMRPWGAKPLADFPGSKRDKQFSLIAREVLSKVRESASLAGPISNPELQELVTYVKTKLGLRTTAYLSGVDDSELVSQWSKGIVLPDELPMQRLRSAYLATRCLVEAYDAQTARTWFLGMNPGFNDEAPARVLRRSQDPTTWEDVVLAAKEFVET